MQRNPPGESWDRTQSNLPIHDLQKCTQPFLQIPETIRNALEHQWQTAKLRHKGDENIASQNGREINLKKSEQEYVVFSMANRAVYV